jgi:hypothetical protein
VDFRDSESVETTEAVIKVDAGLPAGSYVVKLTVIDENGNKSKPARINLKITKRFVGPVRPRRRDRLHSRRFNRDSD